MTIFEALNNNFDNPDICVAVPLGSYNIVFENKDAINGLDETQFDIYPDDTFVDLMNFWTDFAKENKIDGESVVSVYYQGPDREFFEDIA